MKNGEFFSDSNYRSGYDDMYRHNYVDLFKGFSIAEGLQILLDKKTWGAAAFSMFLWGVYGIPIILAAIWGFYFLGNLVTRVVYAFCGTSRKVRWHTNSVLYFIATSWIWVWLPAILFTLFLIVATIPYGLYGIATTPPGVYADANGPEINLIMRLVWDTIDTSKGPVEFVLRYAFWDYIHPIASTIKFVLAPILGYILFYRAHPAITEAEWYEGENDGRDAWLMYERRS